MADLIQAGAATPIVALDVDTVEAAMSIVAEIKDLCQAVKVGSELFTAAGPSVVTALRAAGCDVFLDLKFHDIPTTVGASARSAARLGASLITVHAAGGVAMIRAAVDAAGPGCGVLGVTVLTSLEAPALAQAWGRTGLDVGAEVVRLAGLAREGEAFGVVCSGREVAGIRAAHGDALKLLVPGVRLEGGAAHDQARVVSPGAVARAGASYLVIGRAVTAAADRRAAMRAVLADLAG
jgi:orotidine-5'-phosphate decarboxylase